MRFTFPGDSGSLTFDTVDHNGSFVIDPVRHRAPAGSTTAAACPPGAAGCSSPARSPQRRRPAAPRPAGTPRHRFAAFGTKTVELRLATSFIGLDQARAQRRPGAHRQELRRHPRRRDRGLAEPARRGRACRGETASQRETLYSNLYRLNLYPNSQFENTGTSADPAYKYASPVAAADRAGRPTPRPNAQVKSGKIYVNNGFWDTYRTVWPAYSLLYPKVAAELVDGFVQQYRDGGWVARWSSPGYADLMTGTSSDVAFAGAYLRGVQLQGPARHLRRGAASNATALPTSSGVGRKGLETSIFKKYTDTEHRRVGVLGARGRHQRRRPRATWPRRWPRTRARPRRACQELKDEAAVLRRPVRPVRQPVRPEHRVLPGPQRRRQLQPEQGRLRPRVVGRRLHRDRRLELRLPRPAGRPGPGQPLRRPRRRWPRSSTRSSPTPELADKPGGYGGIDPRDGRGAGRADGPARHEQPAVAPHPVHVRLRAAAVQDAGAGPRDPAAPLRRRPRSARATRATRTTARCRRGTSCPRWASTRCSPARRTGPSAAPPFDKVVVHRRRRRPDDQRATTTAASTSTCSR